MKEMNYYLFKRYPNLKNNMKEMEITFNNKLYILEFEYSLGELDLFAVYLEGYDRNIINLISNEAYEWALSEIIEKEEILPMYYNYNDLH